MPTTRKKVIKTVYKDENDSEPENGDFSDSGSEAVISQPSSSEDDDPDIQNHSEESEDDKNKTRRPKISIRNIRCSKRPITKTNAQRSLKLNRDEYDSEPKDEPKFSIKDLTEADKLLPSILNLSESDSSDDESAKPPKPSTPNIVKTEEIEIETEPEYKDVWSNNLQQSEEVAQKAFLELEKHKTKLEETKRSIQIYTMKNDNAGESDVKDLLALGEELPSTSPIKVKKRKVHKAVVDSDSDVDDWEEVAENKALPQQGLQLIVDFPDAVGRKTKKLDVEMMMKRKINRVKKEYQVYMHKVHVLCWLGHGNYVSQVLNDQEVMSAALSLIPSKDCYPGEKVDMKYVEQITTWFKDKLEVKYDKNEGKYRPKAPPLKSILLQQIQNKIVTSRKYIVFIFVSMLRAVGLQCRIMLNFTTLPIKPPATELCSLSLKTKNNENNKGDVKGETSKKRSVTKNTEKIPQLDGNYDSLSDSDFDNIMQVDGNDDVPATKSSKAAAKGKIKIENKESEMENAVSPPKRPRRNLSTKKTNSDLSVKTEDNKLIQINKVNKNENAKEKQIPGKSTRKSLSLKRNVSNTNNKDTCNTFSEEKTQRASPKNLSLRRTRTTKNIDKPDIKPNMVNPNHNNSNVPKIVVTNSNSGDKIASEYFSNLKTENSETSRQIRARKRSHTSNPTEKQNNTVSEKTKKSRARSVPEATTNKSKYFGDKKTESNKIKKKDTEDSQRVSHRDLNKTKTKPKNDVTKDLVNIVKKRVKEAKMEGRKGKPSKSSDEDSDYLPEITEPQKSNSAKKTKPKPGTSRKVDRRILSTDDETPHHKVDTWCEIYVEELEQWIAVDVIKARVHCVNELYRGASHPVNYVVGWDNNNYLKDLTRRYVPQWNTVTRKQRVEPAWWNEAIQPWLGPRTARDREEDETLDRMQLDAPLPKSIAEYKNHPLYALKRHLLKFEAIYPPDAATLGFVRGEAVYGRDCVYVCRSRDTWLKEAKVVRLGEQPYKVVKARPKWDKLSNKLITDKPLEVFGPWQVQDYEPPVAENGIVPRNAYGNVELFKDCMLPKGTAHIKLPGLNRVAKKLNIDCAPAMTGFDFNGGWSHPVYDGFVVCKEFEEIIITAWHEDQLEQERKETEKLEARVYGNWRRLIKGLLIRERLKLKYGFSEPTTSQDTKKKPSGPRLAVKKKCLDKPSIPKKP